MSKEKQAAFDWNAILYKNVRSKDMRDLGKVVAIDCDSIMVGESRYKIPKSRIAEFDGNDVSVDFIYNDLLLVELTASSYSIDSSRTAHVTTNVIPSDGITHLSTVSREPVEIESNTAAAIK